MYLNQKNISVKLSFLNFVGTMSEMIVTLHFCFKTRNAKVNTRGPKHRDT